METNKSPASTKDKCTEKKGIPNFHHRQIQKVPYMQPKIKEVIKPSSKVWSDKSANATLVIKNPTMNAAANNDVLKKV